MFILVAQKVDNYFT